MKVLQACTRALRLRLLGQPAPIAVTMALTYRCTQRCGYCRIWEAAGTELDTAQVLNTIDQLCAIGMSRLGLTGGEPLLRNDLDAIVSHARSKGLFTTVFTAGALVPERLGTLRKLDAVLVSLDGPQAVHDAQRGAGAYDQALRAIRLLRDVGVPVWTNTVITAQSLDAVQHVLDLAEEYDLHCAFQPVFRHSYSVSEAAVSRLSADGRDYRALIDQLIHLRCQGAPILSSVAALEALRDQAPGPRDCLAGRAYAAVTPNGHVAPCQVMLQAPDLPDGLALGFAEAFRRAQRPQGCRCSCFVTVEADLLFSLDPTTVASTLRHALRKG